MPPQAKGAQVNKLGKGCVRGGFEGSYKRWGKLFGTGGVKEEMLWLRIPNPFPETPGLR